MPPSEESGSPESESSVDELMQTYSEDDSPETTRAIKKQLIRVFRDVGDHGNGSFALSSQAPEAPNPGLFVHNLGSIGMPLSSRDAEALMKASH